MWEFLRLCRRGWLKKVKEALSESAKLLRNFSTSSPVTDLSTPLIVSIRGTLCRASQMVEEEEDIMGGKERRREAVFGRLKGHILKPQRYQRQVNILR